MTALPDPLAPPVEAIPAPAAPLPPEADNGESAHGATAAQFRRFIKSRPYVPLHELRRRFELTADADDVVSIDTPEGRVFVGLPEREGQFVADLARQGDIGLELCRDPQVPIVVGVYPMRPISR
jgi:hypothetical protein